LMNALLSDDGHSTVFVEGHTVKSCTSGVDVCLPLKAVDAKEAPKIAFLDVEGHI
jgi:hypothetical protein